VEQRQDHFAARSFLLAAVKRPPASHPTYRELARFFGRAHQGQRAVLDRLAQRCTFRCEPDPTIVVVSAEGRLGWFLGQPWSEERRSDWESELTRIADYPWENQGLTLPIGQPQQFRSVF
jgi:hypothetical protein